jgi:hypothetical protein
MRVSEWLREYQLTGVVPECRGDDSMIAFWAGWLTGRSSEGNRIEHLSDPRNLDMAIKAAEFIEGRA